MQYIPSPSGPALRRQRRAQH